MAGVGVKDRVEDDEEAKVVSNDPLNVPNKDKGKNKNKKKLN